MNLPPFWRRLFVGPHFCLFATHTSLFMGITQQLTTLLYHSTLTLFSLSSLPSLFETDSIKSGDPPGIDPGTPRTLIPWPLIPSHTCDAIRAPIPYEYRRCNDDLVGQIFTFPTVVFCEIQWVRVIVTSYFTQEIMLLAWLHKSHKSVLNSFPNFLRVLFICIVDVCCKCCKFHYKNTNVLYCSDILVFAYLLAINHKPYHTIYGPFYQGPFRCNILVAFE